MTTVVVIILVALLLFAALRLWVTANRLDRLHVRTEAAWSALEGALARRIVATRSVAAAGGLAHPQAEELRRLADVADNADRVHRADAENDLSRVLSTIPPATEPDLAAELQDASERVVLARRFYNDAVRDTRALRAVLFTRVFGLAGRAAMPDYFEIAEYPHRSGQGDAALVDAAPPADRSLALDSVPADHRASVDHSGSIDRSDPGERSAPVSRTAARVVLVDDADRLLLLSGTDPLVGSRWWITPGGGVEDGEDLPTTALRELAEETGFQLSGDQLVGPVWRRVARFAFTGVDYEQTEYYFAARAPRRGGGHAGLDVAAVGETADQGQQGAGRAGMPAGATLVADPPTEAPLDTSGHTDLERVTLTGHRWWATDALAATDEAIYPTELAARVREVLDALRSGSPAEPVPEIT